LSAQPRPNPLAFSVVALSALAIASLPACAALGGEDGGADNLPDRGISGWLPTATATAPYTLGSVDGPVLGGPSALVDPTTSRLVLWFHQRDTDGTFSIHRTSAPQIPTPLSPAPTSPDTAEPVPLATFTFDAPTLVLDDAKDPSVVRLGDGRYLMAYLDASSLVRLATSADGLTFSDQPATGLPTDARASPSLVLSAPTSPASSSPTPTTSPVSLYTVDIATNALMRQTADLDFAFSSELTVLTPGVECVDLDGEPEPCWDETAITDAEVRLATSPTGRPLLRVFYAGRRTSTTSLGFAASHDGLIFSRYPFNPVVEATISATAPTTVRTDDAYHLFYAEARNAASGGIVHLVSTPPAAADNF
jgi:hypothetical protein